VIKQAHGYLAGAVSGTALISAAVVAFVLLVSFQALHEWPLAGIQIGGGDGGPSATEGPAVGSEGSSGSAVAPGAGSARGRSATRNSTGSPAGTVDTLRSGIGSAPTTRGPAPAGAGSPGSPGSAASPGQSAPAAGSSGSGSGSGPGSGGSSGTSSGSTSTSGAVTGAVNETVKGVDEATGGSVGATGVTETTESAVNGVAGPESTVGKTADGTVETVKGLLGSDR